MKLILLSFVALFFSLKTLAMESNRVTVSQFSFSLFCENKKYWQSNVSFEIPITRRPFVWTRPDSKQLDFGAIAFVSNKGELLELAQFDAQSECSKLPEQDGRSKAVFNLDLPKNVSAKIFMTWDESCQYGVWGWGEKRGWISSKIDQSVILSNSQSTILLTQKKLRSLPFEPTADESTCVKKSKELLKTFPSN